MKKILLTVIFLSVVLLLAVPGFMGWQTEKTMQNMVDQVSELPDYKAHWQSYERGWFTSRGVLLVELTRLADFSADQQAVSLPVEFDLQHGPVLFKSGVKLGWFSLDVLLNDAQEHYLKNIVTVAQPGPLYHLSASMSLLGNTSFSDRWLPFTYNSPSLIVSAESLVGQGAIGVDQRVNYAFVLPKITFSLKSAAASSTNKNMILGDLSSTFDVDLSRLQQSNIAPARVRLGVASLVMDTVFSMANFNMMAVTEFNADNTLLNSQTQLSVEHIKGLANAMPVEFKQLNVDLAYSNIALQFIEHYQALMAKPIGENAAADFYQQKLGTLVLEELLPHSPKLALNKLSFSSDMGAMQLQSQLSIDGPALAGAGLNPQNPLGLVPYMFFTLNAKGDKTQVLALLQQYMASQITQSGGSADNTAAQNNAQMLLESLVAQGFVVVEQDQVSFDFNLAKGQATLNKKPFPLPF
ncbi:MAG: DUF945 family protein [Marinagarivorans sp.]|nr:DUF945 family protein [Marinagarivorans sp.]